MSFVSPEYVIFFAVVVPLFFAIPHRYRWMLLLPASYLFYAYGSLPYLPLIIFSTLVDYVAARMIGATENTLHRRLWLFASIAVNLGVLFTFKYFDFFNESTSLVLQSFGVDYQARPLDLILPVGISFYTFQSMSYTIDVYRRKLKPEKHLGLMATYVAFFPQLVAGPIERATNLMPQFRLRMRFDEARAVSGFRQILWGLFKKVVIADRLALYVNAVYNNATDHSGLTLIVATIFFAIQIYCDFSGYSDIAIGTARVMGFDLMENFRQPYFARSVREFWARWHISLSTWFRDYVYIPLGGNRVSFGRNLFNLMVVFLVSGLWHGAGWTFVIWGALHGLYVIVEAVMRQYNIAPLRSFGTLPRAAVHLTLTFVLVNLAWVFFRANSFDDGIHILTHLFAFGAGGDVIAPFAVEGALLPASVEFVLSWVLIGLLLAIDGLIARHGLDNALSLSPVYARWAVYYGAGAAVMFSGLYGIGAQQFIYFQF